MAIQAPFLENIGDGWTLFLDRDGTINERIVDGYVTNWESFVFLPRVLDALALARAYFERIIIVTNQQGVGKELMTRDELLDIHEKMSEEISIHGGLIDEIYSCESLATDFPNCRKPSPEMAFMARDAFPDIHFRRSVIVGDMPSDMEFGESAGMKRVWIRNEDTPYTPDYDLGVESLAHFIDLIILAQEET